MTITNQTSESMSGVSAEQRAQKSAVQIRLLKGPIYRARARELWHWLERDQFQIREYFQELGLGLLLDDAEGYGFLKQLEHDSQDDEGPVTQGEIPRLISRRPLSFGQTLLLVLLRKRLAEHDSEESSPRLVVNRDEMQQWLQPYFAQVSNEVQQIKDFNALIKRVVDMHFLSLLPNHKDEFEVQRILKAFVSAEQILQFEQVMAEYAAATQIPGSTDSMDSMDSMDSLKETKNAGE